MLQGLGVDVFTVKRMRRALRDDPGFPAVVFTPAEIADCTAEPDPARAFAARFAAKEAALKAVAVVPPDVGIFRDIEVRLRDGRPSVAWRGRLAELPGIRRTRPHLSLAHTNDHAFATVFVERVDA